MFSSRISVAKGGFRPADQNRRYSAAVSPEGVYGTAAAAAPCSLYGANSTRSASNGADDGADDGAGAGAGAGGLKSCGMSALYPRSIAFQRGFHAFHPHEA